jgi:hypothetical protein
MIEMCRSSQSRMQPSFARCEHFYFRNCARIVATASEFPAKKIVEKIA